ncbi:MAG: alpha/beta hydrolase [Bacteroidia bacterium]|nr:MAG: alpha/beta hydrolase [Bacteroidia bacterium]
MKILYLHGLDSELIPEKREILEKYAAVLGPTLDYRQNCRIVDFLFNEYKMENIDLIMGSSMGGYAGYYLSFLMNKPGLFFNPALPYKNVLQFLPKINFSYNKFRKIVIGMQDDTIFAAHNIDFLQNTLPKDANAKIEIINKLQHRVPIDIFDYEIKLFFDDLKMYMD